MITLYGSLHSRANRCAWMLKELGVEFEHVPTNFQNGATREPAFLEINPNGRVPVLDDDGFRLFESLAINLYLARKFSGLLAPITPQEDALATQWSFWALTEIDKPLLLAVANLKLFDAELRQREELEIAVKKLARPFGVLEKHLAARPYHCAALRTRHRRVAKYESLAACLPIPAGGDRLARCQFPHPASAKFARYARDVRVTSLNQENSLC